MEGGWNKFFWPENMAAFACLKSALVHRPPILDLSARALTVKGFDLSASYHGGSVKILSNNECFRKYLDIYRIYPWLRFLWKSKQIKYLLCFSFQLKTLNILNLLLYSPFPVRLVILNERYFFPDNLNKDIVHFQSVAMFWKFLL